MIISSCALYVIGEVHCICGFPGRRTDGRTTRGALSCYDLIDFRHLNHFDLRQAIRFNRIDLFTWKISANRVAHSSSTTLQRPKLHPHLGIQFPQLTRFQINFRFCFSLSAEFFRTIAFQQHRRAQHSFELFRLLVGRNDISQFVCRRWKQESLRRIEWSKQHSIDFVHLTLFLVFSALASLYK